MAILSKARALLAGCSCYTACYRCIKSYKNRFFHGQLDRHLGLYLLDYLLNGALAVWDAPMKRRVVEAVAADVAFQVRAEGWHAEEFARPTVVDGEPVQVEAALRIRGGSGRQVDLLLGLARPLYDQDVGEKFVDAGLGVLDGADLGDGPYLVHAVESYRALHNLPAVSREIVDRVRHRLGRAS